MAAKRTLGWISGLTLATMMAGCASQTPTVTTPNPTLPNTGPAIIDGDTIIVRSDLSVMGVSGENLETRFNAKEFESLPGRIAVDSPEAKTLIPSGGMGAPAPAPVPGPGPGICPPVGAALGPFNLNFPGLWAGSFAGGPGYCPAPYGFAFGTPAVFPKTLFIHPDVYYFRRNALYFPYSRLGGYFYPISVPYGARFYTPFLAYGYGSFAPYTYTSATCPLPAPFPGQLPCGPGIGGPGIGAGAPGGYIPPGAGGPGMGNGGGYDQGQQQQYGKHQKHDKQMGYGRQMGRQMGTGARSY